MSALVKQSGPVRSFVLNPLFTGSLLWALTKAPPSIHEPLLQQLPKLPSPITLPGLVSALKWLFAIGVARKANAWLDYIATNGWSLGTDADQWDWPREIAVVTGGCSGIGELVVKGLAERGVRVAVLDVQPLPEKLKGYNVFFQTCDITDAEAVSAAAEKIRSTLGNPSILINNAGIGLPHTIVDTTPKQVNKIFGVNLLSHWYTVGQFVPDMIKKNKGHIVTVASMASFVAVGGMTDYAATKAGALAFHEGLTQELRHRHKAPNVHTTVVHPNWTRTPLVESAASQLEKHQGPLLAPEDIAGDIVKQVLSCRGAQLIMPKSLGALSGMRGWPSWLQERIRDGTGKLGAGFD